MVKFVEVLQIIYALNHITMKSDELTRENLDGLILCCPERISLADIFRRRCKQMAMLIFLAQRQPLVPY
jgi:hypothetical protein